MITPIPQNRKEYSFLIYALIARQRFSTIPLSWLLLSRLIKDLTAHSKNLACSCGTSPTFESLMRSEIIWESFRLSALRFCCRLLSKRATSFIICVHWSSKIKKWDKKNQSCRNLGVQCFSFELDVNSLLENTTDCIFRLNRVWMVSDFGTNLI